MALSDPRSMFGVHSVAFYNRSSGEFYGKPIKVLGGSSLSLSGETVDLMGGSFSYPWAVENGAITSELSLRFSQFEDYMFEVFLGKQVTSNSAQASGDVSTLVNKSGTVVNATTGIASIAATSGSEADLKFGKYVVKVASATTVDVYMSSDIDFNRGTDGEFQSDLMKITASPLTVPGTGGTVDVPNYGITITGGSGSIALTTGDTAEFDVQPINSGSIEVIVGGATDTYAEFGAVLYAEKRSNGEMVEIDCFRCKAIGMPLNFETKAWSEAEVTAKVFYDSSKNGIFKLRHVQPSSVN